MQGQSDHGEKKGSFAATTSYNLIQSLEGKVKSHSGEPIRLGGEIETNKRNN